MSELNQPPPMMPWDNGPSICQHIRSHLQADGSLAREALELPDEERGNGTAFRFAPGATDGIATHHFGVGDAEAAERTAATLFEQLREYGEAPTAADKLQLYRSFQEANVIRVVDPFLRAVPVAIPGDHMRVQIVKPGEESGQGVGYLNDGTMVVVEQARPHVGDEIEFTVTRALQTSAGRMIFGRLAADTEPKAPPAPAAPAPQPARSNPRSNPHHTAR